ncbi:pseudouridine synthase pus4 [Rhizina undulata]
MNAICARANLQKMIAPLEGLLAINKPTGISSAQALRDLQGIFKASPIFADTLAGEKKRRDEESHNQKKKRRNKRIEVKIGHGGTLDPMASGVLVTGIGAGTKHLQQFLSCTKSYEAVALFGCSTDTYDAVGKIIKRAPYKHITKEAVEQALGKFRGDIMQKPPIYSALHMNGKRLYEYAREGKELPIEIQARPVTCELLELVDFTTDHEWDFPKEEAAEEEKVVCETLEKQEGGTGDKKHAREDLGGDAEPAIKKQKSLEGEEVKKLEDTPAEAPAEEDSESFLEAVAEASDAPKPAAITLRMTVTSGFYVRSLIHDLGEALGSASHMVKLVRTRQGQFEIGKNVLEWTDLTSADKAAWEGQVESTLRAWSEEQKKSN